MTANPKQKTFRDKKYVDSFKIPGEHRCLLTGAEMPDGAHIRYGFHGVGMKPDDDLIIPLAHELHQEQHRIGEVEFWVWHVMDFRGRAGREVLGGLNEFHDLTNQEFVMSLVKRIARTHYREWKERQ